MDKSMLAGLESLPEAYQQRMASMMEQVQIRDRKMQISGATDLASKGQGASDSSNVKIKDSAVQTRFGFQWDTPCFP
ncbi:hypothetical protein HN51_028283 [Arachis hypogaea]